MRRGPKTGVTISLVVLSAIVAGGATYGVLALAPGGDTAGPAPGRVTTRSPMPSPSPTPADRPVTDAPVTDTPVAEEPVDAQPEAVLHPGSTGVRVRELQARLVQLAWFAPPMTGRYQRSTRLAVEGFQDKRGFTVTGEVDRRTWRRLVAMTRPPSEAELFNRAGPTVLGPGASGPAVRELQARLRQIGWFFGDVSDQYGEQTGTAVAGFQGKRQVPATGKVDQRTLDLLEAMTREPTAGELANRAPDPADGAPLDGRCTTGRALCIDKTSNSLRWVVDGKVRKSLDVRFGAEYTPTREGLFSVGWMDRDHVSSLYGSAMPFSMFFSGGQAVHYSSDFAARGYSGASHGCVNVRDYDALAALFDQVDVGDKVVVYRS